MPFDPKHAVLIPRWAYSTAIWIMCVLSLGFVLLVIVVVFWLFMLTLGQHSIHKEVEKARETIEEKTQ